MHQSRESFLDSLIRESKKLKTEEGRKKLKELRGIKEGERKRETHPKAASGKCKLQGVRYTHKELEDGTIVTDKVR